MFNRSPNVLVNERLIRHWPNFKTGEFEIRTRRCSVCCVMEIVYCVNIVMILFIFCDFLLCLISVFFRVIVLYVVWTQESHRLECRIVMSAHSFGRNWGLGRRFNMTHIIYYASHNFWVFVDLVLIIFSWVLPVSRLYLVRFLCPPVLVLTNQLPQSLVSCPGVSRGLIGCLYLSFLVSFCLCWVIVCVCSSCPSQVMLYFFPPCVCFLILFGLYFL